MASALNKTRLKRLRRISPYNGYEFKDTPTSYNQIHRSSNQRTIYTPHYDSPSRHLVLANMRNSEHYVRNDVHFQKPFMDHLEKTGYDHLKGVIRREFYNSQAKKRRKFGSEENMVMYYPDGVDSAIEALDGVEKDRYGVEPQIDFLGKKSRLLRESMLSRLKEKAELSSMKVDDKDEVVEHEEGSEGDGEGRLSKEVKKLALGSENEESAENLETSQVIEDKEEIENDQDEDLEASQLIEDQLDESIEEISPVKPILSAIKKKKKKLAEIERTPEVKKIEKKSLIEKSDKLFNTIHINVEDFGGTQTLDHLETVTTRSKEADQAIKKLNIHFQKDTITTPVK